MNIAINDNYCWRCGEAKENMTGHHAIPRVLNPARNVLIPLCRDCHDDVHIKDTSTVKSTVNIIQKQIRKLDGRIESVLKVLEDQGNDEEVKEK